MTFVVVTCIHENNGASLTPIHINGAYNAPGAAFSASCAWLPQIVSGYDPSLYVVKSARWLLTVTWPWSAAAVRVIAGSPSFTKSKLIGTSGHYGGATNPQNLCVDVTSEMAEVFADGDFVQISTQIMSPSGGASPVVYQSQLVCEFEPVGGNA